MAAGIGCDCQCCKGLLDEWWCSEYQFCDYYRHNGTWTPLDNAGCVEAEYHRDTLRAALEAAGNPECHLAAVLAGAETISETTIELADVC